MKNKLLILSALWALVAFEACTPMGEENIFDGAPTTRVSEKVVECQKTLVASKQGWVVNYFPEQNKYGGFTYIMQFNDDGTVQMSMENQPAGIPADFVKTSLYSLNYSQGPDLSFDSYGLIHIFSDPEVFNYGSGFEGDFELLYKSGSPTELHFEGKKRGTQIAFHALSKDTTSVEYLAAINEMASHNDVDVLFTVEGQLLPVQDRNKFRFFRAAYTSENGSVEYKDISYMYTTTGLFFYEPIAFGTTTVQYLTWNNSKEAFISSDGKVTLAFTQTPRTLFATAVANYELIDLSTTAKQSLDAVPDFQGMVLEMNKYPQYQEKNKGSHSIIIHNSTTNGQYLFGSTLVNSNQIIFNYAAYFNKNIPEVKTWTETILADPAGYIVTYEDESSKSFRLTKANDNTFYFIVKAI